VTAKEQGVPSFVVFSDATLEAIAERRPASTGELAAVPGVGPVKLDRYGAAIVELCAGEASQAEASQAEADVAMADPAKASPAKTGGEAAV
jgi:DNA helicase-2/ATP-dependent DNA helicase PcrA